MRVFLAILLLLPPLARAEEGRYAAHIAGLNDPQRHDRSRSVLLWIGTPALPELQEALAAAQDPARRKDLEGLIAEIREREPQGLRFECGLPKMRLTLGLVNGKEFQYVLRVRNQSDKTVTLCPYLQLRVLDAAGKEVAPAARRGRWGLLMCDCFLDQLQFVTLQPGETWSVEDGLASYMHDPEFIMDWKLPAAGTYTLEFTYAFDRAATKKRCRAGCEAHDDPKRPWNRALELKHTFTCELKVE